MDLPLRLRLYFEAERNLEKHDTHGTIVACSFIRVQRPFSVTEERHYILMFLRTLLTPG